MTCSDCAWWYLASAIDSSGYLTFSVGQRISPILGIVSKNREWLELLKDKFPIFSGPYFHHRDRYRWWSLVSTNIADIAWILSRIIGGLVVKRSVAEQMLAYCRSRLRHLRATYTADELQLVRSVTGREIQYQTGRLMLYPKNRR